jgi:hypothetical protein
MDNWEQLEHKVKEWFKLDKAKLVPGSGNGKGEEDVIGNATIIQCKYTGAVNTSILSKDMTRLKKAASDQEKMPLFVNENKDGVILSIPENENIEDIAKILILLASLDKIENDLIYCDDVDMYKAIKKYSNNTLKNLVSDADDIIKTKFKKKKVSIIENIE